MQTQDSCITYVNQVNRHC